MTVQLRLALRYLRERKLRTTLSTLAIVLGVMLIFGLNGVLPALEGAFRQSLMAVAGQVDLTVTSETRGTFDASAVDTVRSTPGVAQAAGWLIRPVVLPAEVAPKTSSGQPLSTLLVAGLDPATATGVRRIDVAKGRALVAGDGRVALIPDRLAQDTGLGVGSHLILPSATGRADFEIVGVMVAGPSLGTEQVYVPLAAAQELLGTPGRINTIEAMFAAGADATATRQAVLDRLGPEFKLGANEVGTELAAAVQMGKYAFTVFGILALAMGGFIIYNTFKTSVAERRRDIGLLRALGASRRTVLGIVVSESLIQGVVGTAIGLAAGYGLVLAMMSFIGRIVEQLLRLPLTRPAFSTGTFVAAVGLGIGITVLGGISPALAAGRVSPLEAMRPVTPEDVARIHKSRLIWAAVLGLGALAGLVSGNISYSALGAVAFLTVLMVLGPILVEPVTRVFGRLLKVVFAREGRIAEANLIRQPGRAAVTVSAMMIGLAVMVALAGLGTSIDAGLSSYIDTSLGRADYLILPQSLVLGGGNVGAGPELADSLRTVPGVEAVTSIRLATTRLEVAGAGGKLGALKGGGTTAVDLQVLGLDPVGYPRLAGLSFSDGDQATAFAALGQGRSIICNGIFASQAGVRVGDNIALATADGNRDYRVVGVATDILNAKLATAYISQANLAQDFHETSDLLIMAGRAGGADASAVEAGIKGVVANYPAFSVFGTTDWRAAMTSQVSQAVGLLYALVLLLAVPSLIALVNTLGINVIERTRELGMLRAVGATGKQVRRIILAESLLLTAAGTAYGILAGLWLGYLLVVAMKMVGFVLPYFFPYTGVLATIAVGLLFGVVGAMAPARHASRVKIVTALHYE